jgi:hypothetical protein
MIFGVAQLSSSERGGHRRDVHCCPGRRRGYPRPSPERMAGTVPRPSSHADHRRGRPGPAVRAAWDGTLPGRPVMVSVTLPWPARLADALARRRRKPQRHWPGACVRPRHRRACRIPWCAPWTPASRNIAPFAPGPGRTGCQTRGQGPVRCAPGLVWPSSRPFFRDAAREGPGERASTSSRDRRGQASRLLLPRQAPPRRW